MCSRTWPGTVVRPGSDRTAARPAAVNKGMISRKGGLLARHVPACRIGWAPARALVCSSSVITPPQPLPPSTSFHLRTSSCSFSASLSSSAVPATAAARSRKVEAVKSRYLLRREEAGGLLGYGQIRADPVLILYRHLCMLFRSSQIWSDPYGLTSTAPVPVHAVLPALLRNDARQLGRRRLAPCAVNPPRVMLAVRGKVPQILLGRHYAVHALVPDGGGEVYYCALS